MVIPAGRLSVKLTLDIALEPGLEIVKVRLDKPPGLMVLGAKALTIVAFTISAKRMEALKSLL